MGDCMRVTLRKAHDLEMAAKKVAAQIKIVAEVSVSVHEEAPVQYVREHQDRMRQRLTDWMDLMNTAFAVRAMIGRANAEHGVTTALTQKARLDEIEKRLVSLIGSDSTPDARRRIMAAYEVLPVQSQGHENDLHTLSAAILAARKRLETVTTADARQRISLPTFSEKTLDEFREQMRQIAQQRADLMETVARMNVVQYIEIEGDTLESLRRHRLV